jgi:hypothetical protein
MCDIPDKAEYYQTVGSKTSPSLNPNIAGLGVKIVSITGM